MTEITPVNGQKLNLAKALSAGATTVWTFGKFEKTSTGSGILGPQIATLSPWQSVEERVYLDITVEPTLIEDRSAEGQENIYEYALDFRGIDSDNKTIPPTSYKESLQNAHKYGASFILPISGEYFIQLQDSLTAATNNRSIQVAAFDPGSDVSVGDGRAYFSVPSSFDGVSVSRVYCTVITAGATGSTEVNVYNETTAADILSTPATITDTDKTGTGVVDTGEALVSTDDLLRIDIDTVTTTAPKGLIISIEFAA